MPKVPVYLGVDHGGEFVLSWPNAEPPRDSAATRWLLLAEVEAGEELAETVVRFNEQLRRGEL